MGSTDENGSGSSGAPVTQKPNTWNHSSLTPTAAVGPGGLASALSPSSVPSRTWPLPMPLPQPDKERLWQHPLVRRICEEAVTQARAAARQEVWREIRQASHKSSQSNGASTSTSTSNSNSTEAVAVSVRDTDTEASSNSGPSASTDDTDEGCLQPNTPQGLPRSPSACTSSSSGEKEHDGELLLQ